jgi:cytoskeletal protein CcmA (bactofilin family)
MFGRRSDPSAEPTLDTSGETAETATGEATMQTDNSASGDGQAKPDTKTQSGFVPEIPRRAALDLPGAPSRRPNLNVSRGGTESKRLTVGQEISLSGEITACETLVVEGSVEATLENSHLLEIGQTGVFKGTVNINEAVIAGVFQGTLSVRDRLVVKSTGRITGNVAFGQLEVELGGQIVGAMSVFQEPTSGTDDPA